tara:strand:- start:1775 stop:2710 length:936 start_codon:yes stop_codon:yes gene_type:complete
MEILSQNPPEGWQAENHQSHIDSNPLHGILFHRNAFKKFKLMMKREMKPDIVHVHTASDWSWRRKSHYISLCNQLNIPCIVHIHSGNFVNWLGKKNSKRCKHFRHITSGEKCNIIVLNNGWKSQLEPLIGNCYVINNPIDPKICFNEKISRKKRQILFLGRNDKTKGHALALKVFRDLRNSKYPDLEMYMSGKKSKNSNGIISNPWFSEKEKLRLLQESSVILMPSTYEGQSLVMLEALNCGLPCIISDKITDLPDSVIIAKHENLIDWNQKITNVLENRYNGKSLNQSVRKHHIKNINQQWKLVYDDLSL